MVSNDPSICRRDPASKIECQDLRCCCGKLLAKLTPDGVIIRCPRCKREMTIDLADLIVNLDTGWSEVTFREKSA